VSETELGETSAGDPATRIFRAINSYNPTTSSSFSVSSNTILHLAPLLSWLTSLSFSQKQSYIGPSMDNEHQRRTSRGGRPIPSYVLPIPFEASSPSKPPDSESGRYQPISSPMHSGAPFHLTSDDNYEPPVENRYETLSIPESEALKEIRAYIQLRGFDTIFDVFDAELRELEVRRTYLHQQRKLRKWLQGDGPAAILSLYVAHSKLELPDPVKEPITQLFTRIVSQEISIMLKEQSLRKPLKKYKMDTDFTFDGMASTFIASMPSLSAVLHTAFMPSSKTETVTDSAVPDPFWKTNSHSQPQVSTSGVRSDADNLSHNGSGTSEESILPESNTAAVPHIHGRNLMVNTALAILCHAKSERVNIFQGHIGYFLYASKTPKRVIETLCRLGLSVKYESIIEATRAMAASTSEQLQKWKFQVPAPFAVFDNLNYYSRVRDQALHNQPKMLNYTVCYVARNPQTRLDRLLLNVDVHWQKVDGLTNFDVMPTSDMTTRWAKAARASINTTLFRYLRGPMIKYRRRKDGQPLSPWEVDPVYQLPIQKTDVITLPVFRDNEAKVSEITRVLKGITKQMGYTSEELKDYKIVFCGDFLTVRNTE